MVEIPVKQGQEVKRGDIVVILESMKMQNEFKAPRDGTVHVIRVAPGDKVEQNTIMLTIAWPFENGLTLFLAIALLKKITQVIKVVL